MTIDVRMETATSAKVDGYRFVSSERVAVISLIGTRDGLGTPLRDVLRACVERFGVVLANCLRRRPSDRVLLFAATLPSYDHNVVSRRRGLWGLSPYQSLPATAARSESVEIVDELGTRFAGLADVGGALFEAVDLVRTTSDAFVMVSPMAGLSEQRVRSTAAAVFPDGRSGMDWVRVVDLLATGADVIIRATGGFDDREVSLDAFLDRELLQAILAE
jgi:hypothetical protein